MTQNHLIVWTIISSILWSNHRSYRIEKFLRIVSRKVIRLIIYTSNPCLCGWITILLVHDELLLLNCLVFDFSLHLFVSVRNIDTFLLWGVDIVDTSHFLNLLIVLQNLTASQIYLIQSFLRIIVYYLRSSRFQNFPWSLTFEENGTCISRWNRSVFVILMIIQEHFLLILLMQVFVPLLWWRMFQIR